MPKLPTPVAAVFLVAPWITYRWYPKGWKKIDSFHQKPFNWDKIKRASKHFEVFQSTDDDTPLSEGKEIAKKLDGELIVVKNAGHFNTAAGFKTFPLLFKRVKVLLDNGKSS